MRFAFASGVWARTSDLRRLFRCLTLGAAVLARRCHARTEWVCTLLCFLRSHFFPPNFGSRSDDPSPNASLHERVFLYRKEHLATVVRTVGAIDGNPLFSVTRMLLLCGRLGRDSGLSVARSAGDLCRPISSIVLAFRDGQLTQSMDGYMELVKASAADLEGKATTHS